MDVSAKQMENLIDFHINNKEDWIAKALLASLFLSQH